MVTKNIYNIYINYLMVIGVKSFGLIHKFSYMYIAIHQDLYILYQLIQIYAPEWLSIGTLA